ncbi:MAG: thiol peroxidase [Deltaproteobacteria bacterium]|nr:thiol peroxidase [Deltaproteobacteria bacterium]
MSLITLHGNEFKTSGTIPSNGETAPSFNLVDSSDLAEITLSTLGSKRKVLNIFPSLDTPTCAMSVRRFNEAAASLDNTVVLNISRDLPFAQQRFCGAEGIVNAKTLSTFRSSFEEDYNLKIVNGPLAGLASRVVIVLDEGNKVIYSQQVSEISQEPDYSSALKALE